MNSEKISLSIDGQGINVKKDIDKQKFVKIMSIIFSDQPKVNFDEGNENKEEERSERLTSISEFMNDLDARTNFNKIAAIAMYHEDILDNSSINKDIIPRWFSKAGLSVPKNLPRDIKTAIKKDLIAEVHNEKHEYYITNTGRKKLKVAENK